MKIKSWVILILKIIAGYYIFNFYVFAILYLLIPFLTGDKYDGYGGAPYTIRAIIVEKSPSSIRLEIINHSILMDSAVLMQFDPVEKIKHVSPNAINYFNQFQEGQTIIAKTNIHNEIIDKHKRAERVLDVVKVEKDRIDPFGADIHKLFWFIIGITYLAGIFLLFRNELKQIANILHLNNKNDD